MIILAWRLVLVKLLSRVWLSALSCWCPWWLAPLWVIFQSIWSPPYPAGKARSPPNSTVGILTLIRLQANICTTGENKKGLVPACLVYCFWLYRLVESENDPKTDPLILWLVSEWSHTVFTRAVIVGWCSWSMFLQCIILPIGFTFEKPVIKPAL